MSERTHILEPMVRRLRLWAPLGQREEEEIYSLPHTVRKLGAGQYLLWDGDRPQNCCLMLSGYAVRHKVTGSGARQILSIHMKGDFLDLQNSLMSVADHNVQMLNDATVVLFPVEVIRALAQRTPAIGLAMWYETLVEGSIFGEWIMNVGRRDAYTGIAHLLCEFALRLEVAELGVKATYELPITQEQLADAVGLTSVHVNRTLMRLEEGGLIRRSKRTIYIDDWQRMAKVADFHPRYLHLDPSRQSRLRPAIPA